MNEFGAQFDRVRGVGVVMGEYASSNAILRFEDKNREALLRNTCSRRQTRNPGAHYHNISITLRRLAG